VLWTAIKHIQSTEQDVICIVYTGDVDASKNDIITKVHVRRVSLIMAGRTSSHVAVAIQHIACPGHAALCVPPKPQLGRRQELATVYARAAEPGFDVPGVGGHV